MKLIDCRLIQKDRFTVEKGYQPLHSLFYILEGGFSFTVGGEEFEARAGDTAVFPTDIYFERRMLSEMTFYYARVSLSEGEALRCGLLKVEDGDRILSDFRMMEELSHLPPPASELADHYLADVFATATGERLLATGRGDAVIGRAVEYFRVHLEVPVSLAETARACGVSVSALSQRFQRELGCSPMAYLSSMRIARARELLSDGELSVSEISAKCGFENPYYFSNAFFKKTGLRPKDYRKQNRL